MGSKLVAHTRGNTVIYTMQEYIDTAITESFDYRYHRNSLLVGFSLFIFDAAVVRSANTAGLHFFQKLAMESAEYGATICIAGLDRNRVN